MRLRQKHSKPGGRAHYACSTLKWAAAVLGLAVAAASFVPSIDGGVHAAQGWYAYTFAYSAEKVRMKDVLGTRKTLRVTMGKNEREGLQFIVRRRFELGHVFTVSMSDLTSETGGTIPAAVYQESYTFAGTGRDEGLYPDALIPYGGEAVSAPQGVNRGFYIELRTDKDTPAGIYTTQVTIRDAEAQDASTAANFSAPFTVEVVDVTFPDTPYSDSAVGLWGDAFYAVNNAEQGTPEGDALYKQYYDYLIDHRISAFSLPYDILDPRADAYMSDPRVKSFQIPYSDDDALLQKYYKKIQSNPAWARKGYFYPIVAARSKNTTVQRSATVVSSVIF